MTIYGTKNFRSFYINDPILVIFKIKYRFSRRIGAYAASQTTVLHLKRLSQTESPIFVFLCVLCFQRQSLFYFYYFVLLLLLSGTAQLIEFKRNHMKHSWYKLFTELQKVETGIQDNGMIR